MDGPGRLAGGAGAAGGQVGDWVRAVGPVARALGGGWVSGGAWKLILPSMAIGGTIGMPSSGGRKGSTFLLKAAFVTTWVAFLA